MAPGNLLTRDGGLCGGIDFGIMGVGDPACDYAMAWTFFEGENRKRFLEGLDQGSVDRARGWALWKALITARSENEDAARSARETLKAIWREQEESR